MNAMAIFYDPKVSYKKNCIEKFIYRNEKVEKLNDKMTCISAIKP